MPQGSQSVVLRDPCFVAGGLQLAHEANELAWFVDNGIGSGCLKLVASAKSPAHADGPHARIVAHCTSTSLSPM